MEEIMNNPEDRIGDETGKSYAENSRNLSANYNLL